MSKKVQLIVENKQFNIELDEGFALFFERGLKTPSMDIKTLLQAWIESKYELYQLEQKLVTLTNKIEL